MKMKHNRTLLGLLFGVLVFLASIGSAQAQFIGFSADAALAYSANSEALSGGTVGIYHPIPFVPNIGATGLFFERRADGGEGFSLATKVSMATGNIFYTIPVPVFTLALGAGGGTINTKTDIITGAGNIDTVDVTGAVGEGFVRFGLPFMNFFDFHLGYHYMATGEVELLKDSDITTKGVKDKIDFSGGLTTLGILVAF